MDKLLDNIWFCLFVLLLLLVAGYFIALLNKDKQEDIRYIKEELLIRDTIFRVDENLTTKLVDDLKTSSELIDELKYKNDRLHRKIKKLRKKPIEIMMMEVKPETLIDTISINNRDAGVMLSKGIETYYPNKDSFFVRHNLEVRDSLMLVDWNFNNLNLDLVIVEEQKGLYRAYLDAPSWVTVRELNVKTIPLNQIKPENFNWVLGGNVGYNVGSNEISLGIEGGFKYKKYIYKITFDSNNEIELGIQKTF